MNMVSLDNLTHRYGKKTALRQCTLAIPQGSIVALIGPNGAGKSTLLEIIAGLIEPTSGVVTIGHDHRPGSAGGRRATAFMSQEALLYGSLTARSVLTVAEGLNLHFDRSEAVARLEHLGIGLRSKVKQLSGGQQAQLALTLALARHPQLLLLDEPMSDLDPLARREFLSTVLSSALERNQTVIFSSHDVVELARSIDFVVLVAAGRILFSGPLDDLLLRHFLVRTSPSELDHLEGLMCIDRNLDTEIGEHLVVTTNSEAVISLPHRKPTLEDVVLGYLRQSRSIEEIRLMAGKSV
jgi:ABC-2 type transport system ATP-binding protein